MPTHLKVYMYTAVIATAVLSCAVLAGGGDPVQTVSNGEAQAVAPPADLKTWTPEAVIYTATAVCGALSLLIPRVRELLIVLGKVIAGIARILCKREPKHLGQPEGKDDGYA